MERGDGLLAIGLNQRIDRAQHAVHTVTGLAAQALALFLDSVTCPPGHAGQEQIVHLDNVVEQDFADFDQVAGDQRVTLGGCEAPEIASVISTAELPKLPRDAWVEAIESSAAGEQVFHKAQPDDVTLDHSGARRAWVVLETEQAGAGIAVWHFQQQIN